MPRLRKLRVNITEEEKEDSPRGGIMIAWSFACTGFLMISTGSIYDCMTSLERGISWADDSALCSFHRYT
jgi:hypothetical protein